jgi:nucleotide-binding universal stress UspA family protein
MMVGVTQDQVLEAARARLRDVVAREFGDSSHAALDVRIGVPWQEICRYAETEKCDLIVMSTHGYTGIRHVLIGSTAERVVQHAPCPVLTVKTTERDLSAGECAAGNRG